MKSLSLEHLENMNVNRRRGPSPYLFKNWIMYYLELERLLYRWISYFVELLNGFWHSAILGYSLIVESGGYSHLIKHYITISWRDSTGL